MTPIRPCLSGHKESVLKSYRRVALAEPLLRTQVMKFQQQYLNWKILNWSKVDEGHIQIHLQVGPSHAKSTET
jgi:hypothetical protein